MTKPAVTKAPPPPPPPPSAKAVAAPMKSERLAKPLEARFPRLYHDFESVTPSGGGKVEEKMVPKKVAPTLHDVIAAVCGAHGTADKGLIGDLGISITEFLGVEAVKQRAVVKG